MRNTHSLARSVLTGGLLGERHVAPKPVVDWAKVERANLRLQKTLEQYLDATTPATDPAALSVETALLTQELRSDRRYGVGERPLRLLSLGEL